MDFINNKLYADVEGTCTGRYGYIIAVLSISDPGSGTVLPGVGTAEFVVKYTAIVYKPFKGEVVDGQVASVNKMGFFADVGPLQVFVSSHVCVALCRSTQQADNILAYSTGYQIRSEFKSSLL